MPETTWQPVSEIPSLLANEVHIWRIWLNRPDEEVAAGQSLLSPDELARAARFYFDRDRRRYILARGHLRRLLAHYLNAKPMAIRFQYAAQGKPQLAGDADIQFNVSHAQDVALIGLCRGTALGVDVEWVRPLSDMDAVAHRSFSQMEYDEYRGMPEKMKPVVVFKKWKAEDGG
ncbi:MAG: 4'-phosphopantetheinyl transferase family protein, partial [Anaerolineae bacterium]